MRATWTCLVNGVDLAACGPPRPDLHLGRWREVMRGPGGTLTPGPRHTTLFITGFGRVPWRRLTRSPATWAVVRPGSAVPQSGVGKVIVLVPPTPGMRFWQLAIVARAQPPTQGVLPDAPVNPG